MDADAAKPNDSGNETPENDQEEKGFKKALKVTSGSFEGIVNLEYISVRHSIWPSKAGRPALAWIRSGCSISFSARTWPESGAISYCPLRP